MKRVTETRRVTSEPSTICKDGTDEGSQIVECRWPTFQTKQRKHKEGDQGGTGDRPTVGLVLVHQPRGENEKKARGWDHHSSEALVIDVGLQGQPARGFALVHQPRGEDEKEARAGTNAAAKDTNH